MAQSSLKLTMKLSQATPEYKADSADSEDQEGFKKPSSQLSLLGRAIRYLSIREHSQEELIRKLKPHAQSQEELDGVLKKLVEKGLQSNARFAENLVRRKSERYGEMRLRQELKQHQIDTDTRQALLDQVHATEYERAHALWEKKFGSIGKDPKEVAKQARFLANRGFSSEIIAKLIRR